MKRCPYCGGQFRPDPRVGDRQVACPDLSCQRKRHDESHARWLENNEDAFRGRYVKVKRWRRDHPGYQKNWRADNPDKAARDNQQRRERRQRARRAEIQDEITRREINRIRDLRGAEIQDTIQKQIAGILVFLETRSPAARAEIQDSMVSEKAAVAVSRA